MIKMSKVMVILPFFVLPVLIGCTKEDDSTFLKKKCMKCHNLIPVCLKLGTWAYEQWRDNILVMNKAGAKVSDQEIERLAKYLSNQKQDKVDFCK